MRLTRDSALWWLVIVGAITTYLAAMPEPTSWTWAQWMQTVATVAAIVAAKLSTSPLAGKEADGRSSPIDKIAQSIPLLVLVALLAPGCASVRPVAVLADQTFATAVFALDDAEWALYQSCRPDPACETRHAQLNVPIKRALQDVKALTLAIKAAPVGQVPTTFPDLLTDLQAVQNAIVAAAPIAPEIAAKAAAANLAAIAVVRQLLGQPAQGGVQ